MIGDPSPNHDEVLKELNELAMTHGGTDLVASFNAVDRVPNHSPEPSGSRRLRDSQLSSGSCLSARCLAIS